MRMEAKKADSKFDDKDLLELNVKRRVNLCSKISLIFHTFLSLSEWSEEEAFNKAIKIPSNPRQFSMSLGINKNSIIIVNTITRPFLVAMGRSNPTWKEPESIAKGKPVAPSPAKKCPAPTSSMVQKKKKVEDVESFEAEKQEKNTLPLRIISIPRERTRSFPLRLPSVP